MSLTPTCLGSALVGSDDDPVSLDGDDLDGGSGGHELAFGDDGEADALELRCAGRAQEGHGFGHPLTLQAKYGLPLAFITTGQKVPEDIVLPDAHAIASRILSAPLL